MFTSNNCGLSCSFLLKRTLIWAISKWLQTSSVSSVFSEASSLTIAPHKVVLKRSRPIIPVTYQSAIALQLAHQWNQSAKQVATELAVVLTNCSPCDLVDILDNKTIPSIIDVAYTLLEHTKIDVLANSYLQLRLPPSALTIWLQWCLTVPIQPPSVPGLPSNGLDGGLDGGLDSGLDSEKVDSRLLPAQTVDSPDNTQSSIPQQLTSQFSDPTTTGAIATMFLAERPFTLLHAHARCCTILQSAHRCGDITLQSHLQSPSLQPPTLQPSLQDLSPQIATIETVQAPLLPLWTINTPSPIPWESMFSNTFSPEMTPHPLSSTGQSLLTIVWSYLNHLIHTLEALERIWMTHALCSSPALFHSHPSVTAGLPGTVVLPGKTMQQLVNLSQQFHLIERQWTAQSWSSREAATQGPLSSVNLVYLGMVCITQRVLNLPLTVATEGNASLPYEL